MSRESVGWGLILMSWLQGVAEDSLLPELLEQ